MMSQVGEMVVGLVIVLLVIFALARLLQRMNLVSAVSGQSMKVVGGLSLGSRERILLLRVADKHILLGVTAQSISALHTFDELPEAEIAKDGAQVPGGPFARILRQAGGRSDS